MSSGSTQAGAAPYSKLALKIYDVWVMRLSNNYAWRCDRQNFLNLYDEHVGARHLEVGPGSGWLLAHATLPSDLDLVLTDLNPNSLTHTASRLEIPTTSIQHDVLEPFDVGIGEFDSISINYVLHCLPGDGSTKYTAFTNLAARLKPDGVLFGSTVIGVGQRYTMFGSALMAAYNRTGAFDNRRDDLPGLKRALGCNFEKVRVDMIGNVALFTAGGPRNSSRSVDADL